MTGLEHARVQSGLALALSRAYRARCREGPGEQ
jgi:hypothetical protein